MKAIVNGYLVFPEEIRKGTLLLDGETIIAVGYVCVPQDAEVIDAQGLYVGPGLFDEHLHGYKQCGDRYMVTENVRNMALCHLKHGTTSLTPSTAYNMSHEDFLTVIRQSNECIGAGDTNIVGIHFEGPFTNPVHGANSELAWEYSDELCEMIFNAAGKNVLHCTYAPEMPHAREVEKVLQERGVIADIGHTRSDPDNIYKAVEAGAKIVTHLFDAMGNYRGKEEAFNMTGDPQDCVSDIVLSIPGLYYELICDSRGAHVTPVSQRQTLRCAGEDYVIVISDCTARPDSQSLRAADYPENDPRSAWDLNFNLRGQLSGSCLTTADSAANFMKNTGCDMRVAFKCASTNSAKALGLYDKLGSIHPGKTANLVFADEHFGVKNVIFRGKELDEVRAGGKRVK